METCRDPQARTGSTDADEEPAAWRPPPRPAAVRPGMVGIIAAEPATLEDESMLGALLRLMLRGDLDARVKKTLGYLMFEADAMRGDAGRLVAEAHEGRVAGEFRPRSVVGSVVTSAVAYLVPSVRAPGGPLPLPVDREWPYPLR